MDGQRLKSLNLPSILQQQLNQQRNAGRFCDVKLKLPGSELNAHYCVLAALSPYISAQIQSSSTTELVLQLPALLTPKGVGPLLEWMYTSELTLSQDNLLDVSFAAGYFQVEAVAQLCQTFQQNLHHGTSYISGQVTGVHGEYAHVSEEQNYASPISDDRNVVEATKSSESQTDVVAPAIVRVKTEEVPPDPWGGATDNILFISTPGYDGTERSMTSTQLPSNVSPETNSSTPLAHDAVSDMDEPTTPAYLSTAADSHSHLAHYSSDLGLPESEDTVISSPTTGPGHNAGFIYPDNQTWKDQATDVNLVSSSGECTAPSVSPHGSSSDNETPSVTPLDSSTVNPSTSSDRSHEIKIVAVVGSCRKLFYGHDFSNQTTDQSAGLSVQTDQSAGLSVQTDQSRLVDTTCYGIPSGSSEGANAQVEVIEDVPEIQTPQTSNSTTSEDNLQQLPSNNSDEEENEFEDPVICSIPDEAKANDGEKNESALPEQDGENVTEITKVGVNQATSTTDTDTDTLQENKDRDSHVEDSHNRSSTGTREVDALPDVGNKKQREKKKRKADDKHESSSETVSPSKKKQQDGTTRSSNLSKDKHASQSRSSSKKQSPRRSEDKQREPTSKKSTTASKIRSPLTSKPRQVGGPRKVARLRPEDIPKVQSQLRHQQQVPPPVKFLNCYFCDEQFVSEDERVCHLQMKHPGNIPFRCGFCAKGFLYQRELSTHVATHKHKH